ncbi:MAG: tetratricopeptide repeat protein [Spirochaetota bacterium]
MSDYLTAKQLYQAWNLDEAEKLLKSILQKDARFHQARFLLAKTLYFNKKISEAEPAFKSLLKKYPAYIEAEIWLSRIEIQKGELKEADSRLKRLLAFDPLDPRLLYQTAQVYLLQDDLKNGLDFLNKAALFRDEFARVFLDLGRIFYQFGLKEQALSELKTCAHLLSEESLLKNPLKDLQEKLTNEVQ